MGKENNSSNNPSGCSRREFLIRGAAMGAMAFISSPLDILASGVASGYTSSSRQSKSELTTTGNTSMLHRTLGRGTYALEVSALGLGCMGMNYHRGPHPDRNSMIRLIHEAIDRGITLFDTAETYV